MIGSIKPTVQTSKNKKKFGNKLVLKYAEDKKLLTKTVFSEEKHTKSFSFRKRKKI